MVKFLIHRPIAVIMTFVAILLLGGVAAGLLPVSLMPDVDIPEITVQVERPGVSVRELENTVIRSLRQSLMQVAHLDDISSETKEGRGLVRLRFNYGTDINYAFIDVNEKVDAVMRYLPRDVDRPAIVKASATDLPVFYINVKSAKSEEGTARFMELCEFTDAVIRKRLEQLPQVAMVDMTGQLTPELYILPDADKMKSLGLGQDQIQSVLEENNITLGSLQVIDGQYQYNIRFFNALRGVADVQHLYIKANGRILQIKDIAEVGLRPRSRKGLFMQDRQQAVSLAVIKQSDARMEDLKEEVVKLLDIFQRDFPELELSLVRDQTGILQFAISNLKQSLILGGLLAFFIMFFFLKDLKTPWLIGFSIPVSLVISLLCFYLLGLSLNIISLSGLILGVGMMIDNSIIVIDNITQRMDRGEKLAEACIRGTNEVIRPLISSVLTTCAVFLPLLFISGISGALFYDQAIAVTIGLFVSLIVSITLLPTLYRLFWLRSERKGKSRDNLIARWLKQMNILQAEDIYEQGWHWVFRHRRWMFPLFFLLLVLGGFLGWHLTKQRFPSFSQQELVVQADWNERINVAENQKRVEALLALVEPSIELSNAFIGSQQYVLHKDMDLSPTEAIIYLKLNDEGSVKKVEKQLQSWIDANHPGAKVTFRFPETIFERLFADREPLFVARISSQKTKGVPPVDEMDEVLNDLEGHYQDYGISRFPTEQYMEVRAMPDRLALYEVDQAHLYTQLKAALNEYQIGVLRSKTIYVPIVISDKRNSINDILKKLKVRNRDGIDISVNQLVTLQSKVDYKVLHGGKDGEYVPVSFNRMSNVPGALVKSVKNILQNQHDLNVSFSGKLFSSRQLLKELFIVMLIALALLYFILAAQFESLVQPLIVLLEVPMDIAGALGLLYLFGGTINLMAMIGIIVMSGIIINDSILKIDTINQLRRQGMTLMDAIETGGRRRLKPILMTSLTTILALVPFLVAHDMGSELQQPLALTVIGGMTLGTLVSLYFIPLCYYYLYRRS
ncbi:efflux RND transporter permease subunit [Marinilabiliaceae bacterium JC017]|nr:efflux RND transporter permease subunit [Marinilabiliaceae bacterium JC017]